MNVRISVPSKAGVPVFEFDECREITLADINAGQTYRMQTADIDPTDPEEVVRQLEELDVHILIVGGIPPELLKMLNRSSVNLVTGARGKSVDRMVSDFLEGPLSSTSTHSDAHTPAE